MNNFEFYNPVHIVFGTGEIKRAGALASQLGKQALLVTYQDQAVFDRLIETISSHFGMPALDALLSVVSTQIRKSVKSKQASRSIRSSG